MISSPLDGRHDETGAGQPGNLVDAICQGDRGGGDLANTR